MPIPAVDRPLRGFHRANALHGIVAGLLMLLLAGCPEQGADSDGSGASLAMVGTLDLVVVDDPALAQAIEQYRGEWQGQTGSEFQVQEVTLDALANPAAIDADAIIFPSHQLGTLATAGRLRPVPSELRTSARSKWPQIFDLIRTRESVWGLEVLAVPFGSPVLVGYYRADLLDKLGRQPPEDWAEFGELADLLSDREALGEAAPPEGSPWHGSLEPLSPGWAGSTLLARSAAYATHRENYSTLFEIGTMQPLVAGPPFVRALAELKAAASPDALTLDPAAIREAFWKGQCGMALTWPSAAGTASIAPAGGVELRLAELPGSREVYDFMGKRWEDRDDDDAGRVPLLATTGRLAGITSACEWPEATCQLLFWLSSDDHAGSVCAASPATTLFRPTGPADAPAWVESAMGPTGAANYATLTETTLNRRQRLFALRIPGRTQYMAALDEAVRRAVSGEQPPAQALRQAANEWDQITDRLGRENQAKAYDRSLGLE